MEQIEEKKEPNPIGRPSVMTAETIDKLEEGFLMGLNDTEACLFANIGSRTLYDYCTANPEFSQRKEELKENIKMIAKRNIADGINKGEKPLSQWYLERRDKGFKPKAETEHSGDITVKSINYGDGNNNPPQIPA